MILFSAMFFSLLFSVHLLLSFWFVVTMKFISIYLSIYMYTYTHTHTHTYVTDFMNFLFTFLLAFKAIDLLPLPHTIIPWEKVSGSTMDPKTNRHSSPIVSHLSPQFYICAFDQPQFMQHYMYLI